MHHTKETRISPESPFTNSQVYDLTLRRPPNDFLILDENQAIHLMTMPETRTPTPVPSEVIPNAGIFDALRREDAALKKGIRGKEVSLLSTPDCITANQSLCNETLVSIIPSYRTTDCTWLTMPARSNELVYILAGWHPLCIGTRKCGALARNAYMSATAQTYVMTVINASRKVQTRTRLDADKGDAGLY